MKHIAWGVTGSVAAVRAGNIASALLALGAVRGVATAAGRRFLEVADDPLPPGVAIEDDESEWRSWRRLGDPVLHIEMRKWADVLVIAPLSADALAKLAHGFADNLLLSVARAWDFRKPMILAPAMNTLMWEHPVTAGQLATVQQWGATIVPPVAKELACGDVGVGGMAAPAAIAAAVREAFAKKHSAATDLK